MKLSLVKRTAIYMLGIVLVSMGIVLCKKCGLGISPVSSIPFALEEAVPFSFGTLTMGFHLVNILIQLFLAGKVKNVRILLQIPVACLFGQVIDVLQKLIRFDEGRIVNQGIALALSVFFTALGMVLMIRMDLVQNPPDGLVKLISQKSGRELGQIKIMYDIVCVAISAAAGLALSGKVRGMGIATVVSAVFVGRTVTWLKERVKL